MQNKEENKISSTMVNQGWEAMHGILDTEIPVKKKRKILPFLWIFLIGLGLGFGLFFAWDTFKERENAAVKIETPIAVNEPSQNLNENKETFDSILSNKESKPFSSTTNILPAKAQSKTKSNAPPKILVDGPNVFAETENFNEGSTKSNSILLSETSNQKSQIEAENPILQKIAEETLVSQGSDFEKGREQIRWNRIEIMTMNLLDVAVLEPKHNLLTVKNRQNNPQFGLRIGGGHDLSEQSNFNLGLWLQHRFKPKWAFETGLSYYIFPKFSPLFSRNDDLAFVSDAEVELGTDLPDEQTPVAGNGGGGTQEDNMPGTEMSNAFSTRQFLSNYTRHGIALPVNVSYKLAPRWELLSGMRLAYIFSVGNSNTIGLNGELPALESSPSVSNGGFEIWTNANVRFWANKNLAFELGYNYSWANTFNKEARMDSNIFINADMDTSPKYQYHFTELSAIWKF